MKRDSYISKIKLTLVYTLYNYVHFEKFFFESCKSTVILNMSWLQTDDIKSEGIMTEALKSLLVLLIGKIPRGPLFSTINI